MYGAPAEASEQLSAKIFVIKESWKIFPQETMAAGENRFAPELNEKEIIELLENAIPCREHKESHKVWHENILR